MCSLEALLIAQGGMALNNLISSSIETDIAGLKYETLAGLEESDARILEGQKEEERFKSQLKLDLLSEKFAQTEGRQLAIMGVSGVDFSSPSFQNLLKTTDLNEAMDISLLKMDLHQREASIDLEVAERKRRSKSLRTRAREIRKSKGRGLFIGGLASAIEVGTDFAKNKLVFDYYKRKKDDV